MFVALTQDRLEVGFVYAQKLAVLTWKDTRCSGNSETYVNSLAPWGCGNNFKSVISEYMLQIQLMRTFCESVVRWIPKNIFDNKSASLHVYIFGR